MARAVFLRPVPSDRAGNAALKIFKVDCPQAPLVGAFLWAIENRHRVSGEQSHHL